MPLDTTHIADTDNFYTWRVSYNQSLDFQLDKSLNLSDIPNATTARQNLGLEIGVDVPAYNGAPLGTMANQNSGTVAITGGTINGVSFNLGTFTNVTITSGSITGITDLAIADGGTGASTATAARTNLDVYSTAEVTALVDDLSGVTDPVTARANLGVYSALETDALVDDLSGVTDPATARTNLDVYNKTETLNEATDISIAMAIALS